MKSFGDVANREGAIPGHDHTFVRKLKGGAVAIVYYRTEIVTFHPDGRVVFKAGKWRTPSTIRRFNLYCPEGFQFRKGSIWEGDQDMGEWSDGVTIHNGYITAGLKLSPRRQRVADRFVRA